MLRVLLCPSCCGALCERWGDWGAGVPTLCSEGGGLRRVTQLPSSRAKRGWIVPIALIACLD